MAIFLNMRYLNVDGKEYSIPADLSVMYVNGTPFAHFRDGHVNFDADVMDDYAICVESMPYECPDYLKDYIKKHFKVRTQ